MINLIIGPRNSKFSGDPQLLQALYNFLSFKHPDGFYIRQRIGREWDGMVHPMTKAGSLPTGLVPKAVEFLINSPDFNEEDLRVSYSTSLPQVGQIPVSIGGHNLRFYQTEAIKAVLSGNLYGVPWLRGFIFGGMGAGKTLMMFGLYESFSPRPMTIILIDNSKLYIQIKRDLGSTYPTEYGYMQGKDIKWGNIMVCMVKTVKLRLKEFKKQFNKVQCLLVDEADLSGNQTYISVFKEFENAHVRVGFSGTVFLRDLKKDALRNTTLRGNFGDVLYSITSKDLEEQGYIAKVTIKLIPGIPVKNPQPSSFIEEFETIIGSNENMALILKRVKYNLGTHKYPIMVFTRFIKQTETLWNFLKNGLPNTRVEFAHHKKADQSVLDEFKDGHIQVLVCSLFLKRGLSFPLVRCIINASAGEFYSNPLQILGRGTRTNDGKKMGFIFEDIMDEGYYLANHTKQRIKQYKSEGYTIRDLRIKLKK